jgi:uncharacterized SAM-binding protein YcdF (DUF218 family)
VTPETRALAQRAAVGFVIGGATGLLCKDAGLGATISFSGPPIALVWMGGVIGALVSLTRARRIALAFAALVAAFYVLVAYTPLAAKLAPLTERVDTEAPGDAVFVFGSGFWRNGDPDPEAMARLHHGIEIVAAGRAPVLVVSEATEGRACEELARRWMTSLHVQGEVVDVGRVGNTHDEAVLLAREAQKRGWTRIVAVTSPTHSRRACATLEHEGLVAIASPAIETMYPLPDLERADERLNAIGPVLHELIGIWAYRRRGWIR